MKRLAIAVLFAGALLRAEHKNPFAENERAARAGAKLFRRECSACHGSLAQGGHKAPPLAGAILDEATERAAFRVLRDGMMRGGMPSFAHLPEAQRWQILTYLRGLATPPSSPR